MDLHGGDLYRNDVEYDFSVSLNPCGCPARVTAALHDAVGKVTAYPDLLQERSRKAIAKIEGVAEENVILTNGASELFMAIARILSKKPAVVPVPSFSGYAHALRAADIPIRPYLLSEENGFLLTEEFREVLDEQVSSAWICNPNNPTGKAVDAGLLKKIVKSCREKGILPVIDCCFSDLCESSAVPSLKELLRENAIIIKAFTKTLAIPGVRLGYAVCEEELAVRIRANLPEWNLSGFGEAAAISGAAVLTGSEYLKTTRSLIKKERAYLTEELQRAGLKVYPSDTCFLLVRSCVNLKEKLLAKKILIRDCANFAGLREGYYRIAVKDHASDEILIRAVKEVLSLGD